ncbi:MAG: T9SS type A sorting domain-containing protein [Bacteroidota bacterium]
MEKRTYTNLLFFFLFSIAFLPRSFAQASCVNCPIFFWESVIHPGLVVSQIEVETDGPNNLLENRLTSACVLMEHPGASDIFIVLIAPDGRAYYLLGDDNNNAGGCIGPFPVLVDVCFSPGNTNPITFDSPYINSCIYAGGCPAGEWNVSCGQSLFSDLFPLATPTPNCDLDDFNIDGAPVEGVWTLVVGCVCMQGEAEARLVDWSLDFEQASTSTDQTCFAPEGEMVHTSVEICQESNFHYLPFAIDYEGFDYPEVLGVQVLDVLLQEETIVAAAYFLDAQDLEPGVYQGIGLQFERPTNSSLNPVIEALSGMTKEEANDYLHDQDLCFTWSSSQMEIIISTPEATIYEDAIGCPGECVIIQGTEYCDPGSFEVILEAQNGRHCDTTIIVGFSHYYDEDDIQLTIPEMPCLDEAFQLQVEGALTYEWIGPNGFHSTAANPMIESFGWDDLGTYTVYLGMPGDCETSRVFEIQELCKEEQLELEVLETVMLCSDGPIMQWDYCQMTATGITDFQVIPSECLEITGLNPGSESICLEVGAANLATLYHTIHVNILEPEYSWPGDLNFDGLVNHVDALYLGLAYELQGTARIDPSTVWAQQYTTSWSGQTPESQINHKHLDADGNGQINADDLLPIQQNWQQSHPEGQNPGLPNYAGNQVASLHLELPELQNGQWVDIPLHLGTENQAAQEIYGLAFRMLIDPALLEGGNLQFEFHDNFLGTVQEDWLSFVHYEAGVLSASLTRKDGQAVDGFGPIASLSFQVATDYPLTQNVQFELINDLCLKSVELPCGIVGGIQTTELTTSTSSVFPSDWQLSPNPASDRLYLNTNNSVPDQVFLMDIQSKVHQSWTPLGNATELVLENIAPGLYIFVIDNGQKRYHQRLVIVP